MAKTIGQLTQATTLASGDEFVIEQSGLTKRVAASVVRGGLVNADIDAAAAIAGSKLADGGIVTAKIADANVTPAKLSQPLTLATAQNTTSGTSIDFTAIPSWVRRITVLLSGVSLSGSSNLLIQLGDSGGIETTGYAGSSVVAGNAVASAGALFTTGIGVMGNNAANVIHGTVVIHAVGSNVWVASGSYGYTNTGSSGSTGSSKTLSDTLTQVRLTTVNGTDTFDAGSVNIMYEG
jgi:hypothetical protein